MPDLAQRKHRGSVAGDTQTFAALVADNAGNTLCSADKNLKLPRGEVGITYR